MDKKRKIFEPKWIFVTVTIPQTLLILLFFSFYNIISSQLESKNITFWHLFFSINIILNFVYTLIAILFLIKKKNISEIIYPFMLVTYVVFLYLFVVSYNNLFPSTIPAWIINLEEIFLYIGTFIVPVVMYSLFALVLILTDLNKKQLIWNNFLISIIIPLSFYFFMTLLFHPLMQKVNDQIVTTVLTHSIIVFLILLSVIFYFFLLRGIFLIITKLENNLRKFDFVFKIVFSLILPAAGLMLNEGFFFKPEFNNFHPIFGDFSNPFFFILTILTGVVISIPQFDNKIIRMILFGLRSLTLSFTLYFFIAFLPFYPFAIVATIILGLGFLIISPLLLGFFHFNTLREDFLYLKTIISGRKLVVMSSLLFLIIPSLVVVNFNNERNNLHNALRYLYQIDYEKNYDVKINLKLLKRSLEYISRQKGDRGFFASKTPFITPIYNSIVFDNMILSEEKIQYIKRVFFAESQNTFADDTVKRDIKITAVNNKTTYNNEEKLYHSFIDLEITNNEEFNNVEYKTDFKLPEGSWINNYYLYIGDKKITGLLAEKKSVLWIYNEIKTIRRDPGILYYRDSENLTLKVFPFSEKEKRRTGFEIIHIEPFDFVIDENTISLRHDIKEVVSIDNKNSIYINSNKSKNFEKVELIPYYHFVIDCGMGSKERIKDKLDSVKRFIEKEKIYDYSNSRITFLNYNYKTFTIKEASKIDCDKIETSGGFFLDRFAKKVLFDSYKESRYYPVVIVLTDDINRIILNSDIKNWRWINPNLAFYHLQNGGKINQYSLFDFDLDKSKEVEKTKSYLGYKIEFNGKSRYIPDISDSQFLFDFEQKDQSESVGLLAKCLEIESLTRYNLLYPSKEEDTFLKILKLSFQSNILTEFTSFAVFENEMQINMLKKKQAEVISGKKFFDTTEETSTEMSEPGFFILLLLVLIIFLVKFFLNKRTERIRIRKKS